MHAGRVDGLKVALVYPPYGPVKNEPGIKAVKENYGIFPSLSLLYVAGVAVVVIGVLAVKGLVGH